MLHAVDLTAVARADPSDGDAAPLYDPDGPTAQIAAVLLNELIAMPTERLHLPITRSSKLRMIADALMDNPADRRTVAEWAQAVALGERTLMRIVLAETGITFSRWRQQLQIIVAIQKLSAGDTVQSVSGALGYESVRAFITMFKKALGRVAGALLLRARGRPDWAGGNLSRDELQASPDA